MLVTFGRPYFSFHIALTIKKLFGFQVCGGERTETKTPPRKGRDLFFDMCWVPCSSRNLPKWAATGRKLDSEERKSKRHERITNINKLTPRIQSMDYLHAFGYARSQSVRPCYLRSDHDFCMHFRQFIFRLISDKFRQSMGNSRWPCHGLSRSVTAFSDNAQDLSIVFCLLSRFVTVCHGLSRNMLGNLKPIWTFFR